MSDIQINQGNIKKIRSELAVSAISNPHGIKSLDIHKDPIVSINMFFKFQYIYC